MKAKVLFFQNKSGGVSCKVKLYDTNGFKYRKGELKSIRLNQEEDKSEYPLIIPFIMLDDFLNINGVKFYEEVEVDQNSLDVFYGYNGYGHQKAVATLTPGFVKEWWNMDCPFLFRYEPNKTNEKISGLCPPYFTDQLVESSCYGAYISRNITEAEVKALTNGREHTVIYKEMVNVLAAKAVSPEQVDEYQGYVDSYEAKIQSIIDNNKVAIVAHLFDSGMFDEAGQERNFGFDCGFLNVFTENPEYAEKKGILKYVKGDCSWLKIELPYNSQSLTVMQKQFDKVKDIVLAETGERLYCTTMPD